MYEHLEDALRARISHLLVEREVFTLRIEELEQECSILRKQRNREIDGRLFAEELLARGIRAPGDMRFQRDGSIDESEEGKD